LSRPWTALIIACIVRMRVREAATSRPPIADTSAPAQNASPAPVSTTARTASSVTKPRNASSNVWRISSVSAFFRAGLLIVTSATAPRRSTSIVVIVLPSCGRIR